MTAKEVLDFADLIGCPVSLRPDGTPAVGGKPNAVLLGSLKQHRTEIISLLGGKLPVCSEPAASEPDYCKQCDAWVFEAEDTNFFCNLRRCEFRRRVRYEEGPF